MRQWLSGWHLHSLSSSSPSLSPACQWVHPLPLLTPSLSRNLTYIAQPRLLRVQKHCALGPSLAELAIIPHPDLARKERSSHPDLARKARRERSSHPDLARKARRERSSHQDLARKARRERSSHRDLARKARRERSSHQDLARKGGVSRPPPAYGPVIILFTHTPTLQVPSLRSLPPTHSFQVEASFHTFISSRSLLISFNSHPHIHHLSIYSSKNVPME